MRPNVATRAPMAPHEVVNRARANCISSVRQSMGYLRADAAAALAEETVVRVLRGRPVSRVGGVVRFSAADCSEALRVADAEVRRFLAA